MTSDNIQRAAAKLLKRCGGTRNPFKIAQEIGVRLHWRNDFVNLKGMYAVVERNRFIFINANLDEYEQSVVCTHELGHDALHRDFTENTALHEVMLYDMSTRPEYEANVFAAEILLSDAEVFSLAEEGFVEG